jgi:hypothetical protein
MGDAVPQKVKRVTKKAKSTVVESAPVVSSETKSSEVVVETNVKTTDEPASTSVPAKEKEIRLTEIPVVDEITALNLMVSFLGLAQKRGAYTIDEASKIWECIKKFQRPV